jgi:hypothetical protein
MCFSDQSLRPIPRPAAACLCGLYRASGSCGMRDWKEVSRRGHTVLTKEHAAKFQEIEAQPISDRYHPSKTQTQLFDPATITDDCLKRIYKCCQLFDNLQLNISSLQEEQERELSPEIEQVRQVQRAQHGKPHPHNLHPDVERFALQGIFAPGSSAYMRAFESLKDSSAKNAFPLSQLTGRKTALFATSDFVKTVKQIGGNNPQQSDLFFRPVQ